MSTAVASGILSRVYAPWKNCPFWRRCEILNTPIVYQSAISSNMHVFEGKKKSSYLADKGNAKMQCPLDMMTFPFENMPIADMCPLWRYRLSYKAFNSSMAHLKPLHSYIPTLLSCWGHSKIQLNCHPLLQKMILRYTSHSCVAGHPTSYIHTHIHACSCEHVCLFLFITSWG